MAHSRVVLYIPDEKSWKGNTIMCWDKESALNEIKKGICGCFGNADTVFMTNSSAESQANALRGIAREYQLTYREIEQVIKAPITEWLTTRYWRDGRPQSRFDDKQQTQNRINAMISEASSYISFR
jgi:hypothetical protein